MSTKSPQWSRRHRETIGTEPRMGEPSVLEAKGADTVDGSEVIRRFARAIDLAWQEARQGGAPVGMVVALGEASHGLHRALITLAECSRTSGDLGTSSRRSWRSEAAPGPHSKR